MRDPESEVIRKIEMTNKEIREAKDELYRLSRDEKEREMYYLREKSIKDEISALANSEEKGIEKGIIESAKKLMNILEDNTISTTLGIDIELVRNLRNQKC